MAGVNLYPYQMEAIKKMKNGCILNGGVGSGKSITAIGYYYLLNGGSESFLLGGEYIPADDPPMDLYIITTARKRDTLEWEKELSRFLMSINKETNLYTNTIVVDSWNNLHKYSEIRNAFFIFDEQRVVGSGTWVKNFLITARKNRWILLSATPGDTWSDYIPVFVANGFYKNRSEFIREHVIYSRATKYPKIDRYVNTGLLLKHRSDILVSMDQQKEKEIRSTTKHHENIFVRYSVIDYKRIMRERWDIWNDEPLINAASICYALRKVVNSDESRQAALLEIAERHPKIIVFYNFDYELSILKELAYLPGTRTAEWNGHKHQPIPITDRWLYFVQYAAGAEGWNCIETNTMVFYSQNYSYKTMQQAAGRIDRLNTPYRDLYYFHLRSQSGIDLAIAKALGEKKNFNESAFIS